MKIKSLTRVRRVGPEPRHPRERHFPKARAGFVRVSCGRYTHAHAACHVGLNGGICIFYKLGVICIPGRASPIPWSMYHDASAGARAPGRYRSSIYRRCVSPSERQVGSSGSLWSNVQSTLPFITSAHRYADEYQHEFN